MIGKRRFKIYIRGSIDELSELKGVRALISNIVCNAIEAMFNPGKLAFFYGSI